MTYLKTFELWKWHEMASDHMVIGQNVTERICIAFFLLFTNEPQNSWLSLGLAFRANSQAELGWCAKDYAINHHHLAENGSYKPCILWGWFLGHELISSRLIPMFHRPPVYPNVCLVWLNPGPNVLHDVIIQLVSIPTYIYNYICAINDNIYIYP